MDFTVLAEGLAFPEGPVVLPDGAIVLVEMHAGVVSRHWGGRREVVAILGGGPNGAALGPDGALYVCNNGGQGPFPRGGRIERVDLSSGRFERVYDHVGDHPLSAPNDLVFDRSGGFWFTDFGAVYARGRDLSGIYYAQADGGAIREVSFGGTGYNGIGLSPDESTVYAAETYTGRLIAFDLAAPGLVVKGGRAGRLVAGHADHRMLDSLAVQADGAVCVATIGANTRTNGGVTAISPAGEGRFVPLPDPLVTNLCFGGPDMRDAYITLSGDGRLIQMRWPAAGLPLNHNPY